MIGNRVIGVSLLVIVALALVDVSEACKKCGIQHCDCLPQHELAHHELAHHHLAPMEYQQVYYAQPEPPPPPPPATYAYYAEPEPAPAPPPPPPPPPPATYSYYCYPPPPPAPICKVCGGHSLHDHLLKKLLQKKLCQCY